MEAEERVFGLRTTSTSRSWRTYAQTSGVAFERVLQVELFDLALEARREAGEHRVATAQHNALVHLRPDVHRHALADRVVQQFGHSGRCAENACNAYNEGCLSVK